MTRADFDAEVETYAGTRRITAIHMHHTWRPNHSQYLGQASIEGMWRHQTETNGWSDIAQHISIGPDGSIWSGRDWNRMPASARGFNGNRNAGPFMFEMIGDFDIGRDLFGGDQKETVLHVITKLMTHFQLEPATLRFHNQLHPAGTPPPKTCPGKAIDYDAFLSEVRERLP